MIYILVWLGISILAAILWAIFVVPKCYSQKTESVKAQAEMDRINQQTLKAVETMPTTLSSYHITVRVTPEETTIISGTDLTERHFKKKKAENSEEYSTVHLQRTLLTNQFVGGAKAFTFVFLLIGLIISYFE